MRTTRGTRHSLPTVLTLLAWSCSGTAHAESAWQVVHKQSAAADGSSIQPSIRYGHATDRHGDKMLMSLGYYYDRELNAATWKSDTWEMDMLPPYSWTRLDAGISQDAAYDAYTSNKNYEPGYDFDELWSFSIPKRSWALVFSAELRPQQHRQGPGKRYLHAAVVVGDLLVVYGGLAEGQGDVWGFDLVRHEWEQLAVEAPRSAEAPGRRVGHSMTPVDQPGDRGERVTGFLLLGGRYIDADGSTALDDGAFFFDLGARRWRRLAAAAGGGPAPAGRKYHAEASAWVRVAADGALLSERDARGAPSPPPYAHVTVMFGGTVTTPGLSCTAEAWLLTMDCGATSVSWLRLPDLETAVYDARGAASADGSVFGFGGHLCFESKGSLPFYYVNTVHRLDLAKAGVRIGGDACRVPAGQLPRQRGQGESNMAQEL